jgi:hypothetical protein
MTRFTVSDRARVKNEGINAGSEYAGKMGTIIEILYDGANCARYGLALEGFDGAVDFNNDELEYCCARYFQDYDPQELDLINRKFKTIPVEKHGSPKYLRTNCYAKLPICMGGDGENNYGAGVYDFKGETFYYEGHATCRQNVGFNTSLFWKPNTEEVFAYNRITDEMIPFIARWPVA